MKRATKRPRSVSVGHFFNWVIGAEVFPSFVGAHCMLCGAAAIVKLPPPLLAQQPDDTTHVCHPMFRGCNHGFAKDTK